MRLRAAALSCALGEAGRGVVEVGGNNRGEDVREYLRAAAIPVPAPWCAAFVQAVTDRGARLIGVANPLDAVVREALVADYVTLAESRGWIVTGSSARRGDLIAFRFGATPTRWNHIGMVAEVRRSGSVTTVEGNTGPTGGRDGDGVYVKTRALTPGRVVVIRWDGGKRGALR